MKVIAFIGPSGTGKSHRAGWVSKEKELDFIIDDGLLINLGRIVAGKSAKKEPTKIGSVKCALFHDNSHAEEVRYTIEKLKPNGILIIGTSKGMVNKIARILELKTFDEFIFIEDVASEYEIQKALSTRKDKGKHVIPVPTLEIKKEFSGYFLDPLQIFRKKGKADFQHIGEKSVVRPTFSYLGKYTISEYTIYQIAERIILDNKNVSKIARFRVETQSQGAYIEIDLVLFYGCIIKPIMYAIQKKVCDEIEYLTGINIKNINLVAKSLDVNKYNK